MNSEKLLEQYIFILTIDQLTCNVDGVAYIEEEKIITKICRFPQLYGVF